MSNDNTMIKTHKMMNAPRELISVGIEEVANAPQLWSNVSHVTQLLGEVKFTKTSLVHAVRAVNRVLRLEGMKPISTSKKTKEDIIDELDRLCYQDTEMYGFSINKNKNLLLTKKTLVDFAHAGLLTQELGLKSYLRFKSTSQEVESIVTTGHDSFSKKNWVNSACETEGFVGRHALSGFGTFTEERNLCNNNKDVQTYGIEDYADCYTENGVLGYARKGTTTCQVCGGKAELEWHRPSVSKKNGTFLGMPFIRMTRSPFKEVTMSARTEMKQKKIYMPVHNDDGEITGYEDQLVDSRIKTESIQPKLVPVHIQKNGGRVARKINGKTVWVDVYFQQLVFESESSQSFAVWCAVECSGIESKKYLDKVFMPHPSSLSQILTNTLLNDANLNFPKKNRVTELDELVNYEMGSDKFDRDYSVEDGAGVV